METPSEVHASKETHHVKKMRYQEVRKPFILYHHISVSSLYYSFFLSKH
jgi:hypothetical protein